MEAISYDDIINCFDKKYWDFSYLTYDEIWETLNHPIKYTNLIERLTFKGIDFPISVTFLVAVKLSPNFDYSLVDTFFSTCKMKLPQLDYDEFLCNYKYAAVQAGLGQYAKNSLFYHPIFQFDTHLAVFIIFNPIKNLPQRNKPNFELLSQCNGCDDCFNACPVNAIHCKDKNPWIDLYKCDNFCHFGNHKTIPSIKWNWLKVGDIKLSNEEIYNIHDFYECRCAIGETGCTNSIIKNNKQYHAIFPVCRECVSQPRCSKYNGNYPYKWDDVILYEVHDENN